MRPRMTPRGARSNRQSTPVAMPSRSRTACRASSTRRRFTVPLPAERGCVVGDETLALLGRGFGRHLEYPNGGAVVRGILNLRHKRIVAVRLIAAWADHDGNVFLSVCGIAHRC